MSVFTELIQKSSALKSAENEVKVLRQECLQAMKEKGEEKLTLPNMGSISIRTRKPSKSKIDDPEINQIRAKIESIAQNLEDELKAKLYSIQREIFLCQRRIYSLLRTTEIVSLEEELFRKTLEYLQRESTEYLVVKVKG